MKESQSADKDILQYSSTPNYFTLPYVNMIKNHAAFKTLSESFRQKLYRLKRRFA